jgi:hypothetical protein
MGFGGRKRARQMGCPKGVKSHKWGLGFPPTAAFIAAAADAAAAAAAAADADAAVEAAAEVCDQVFVIFGDLDLDDEVGGAG